MRSGTWNRCAMLLCAVLGGALGMMLQSARGSSGENEEPRVTGAGGFFFKAKSPGKLADWYRTHLGVALQAAGKGENAPQMHMFMWSERDHAEKHGSTVLSIFPANTDYFGPGGSPFMIDFRVANLDRLLTQLRKEGVKVVDKVDEEPYGRFGWVEDAEGNRIELWEPK